MRTWMLLLIVVSGGCAEGEQPTPGDGGDGGVPRAGEVVEATDLSSSPDSVQAPCPFQITEHPPSGEARLLAAYKICPGCLANLPEYLMNEHGRPSAYLYDDGRLIFREQALVGFVHRFQEKMVTEAEACALLDGVDQGDLADEAAAEGSIMYREATDAPATLVYLRDGEGPLEIDLHGSVHDDFGLTTESAARAANSARLALNLSALATGGAPYEASDLALWATTGEAVEFACPSDPVLPEWPFEDVPLLDMQEMEVAERTVPLILVGTPAQEVRDWALEQEAESPCWELSVRHGEQDWRIILVDLPPDGYEGHPVSPCWTTGC